MSTSLVIYLARDEAALRGQVRALSPRIELVSPEQLQAQPELLASIEVAYEGLSREQLPKATALRWLQMGGAGVNNVLSPEIRDSALLITNVSGIHARCITEHMFGLLLGVTRALNLAQESQSGASGRAKVQKSNPFTAKHWEFWAWAPSANRPRASGRAFDMKVIGLRHNPHPVPGVEAMFTPDTRYDFFRTKPRRNERVAAHRRHARLHGRDRVRRVASRRHRDQRGARSHDRYPGPVAGD
jgi:phosphoglycerate dehydrogenase-like enzyme